MHRLNTLSSVLLLVLTLLVGACQEGGDYTETAAEDTAAASMDAMAMPEAMTVTGTLVDTKCYGMNHANTGNDHAMPDGSTVSGCGAACAGMGIPVALLEGGQQDGRAYVLITPATGLAQHVAKEARVTGTATFESGLTPTKVEVKNADGQWVDVTPGAMM